MGTSKGYIAPTTVHWSSAKRAVTAYIKNGDSESCANAACKYAKAMHNDITSSVNFSKAVGNILAFAKAISNSSLNEALYNFNRSDLIGKSSNDIYNELIEGFTNYGSTVEDYLSAESIRSALKILDVTEIEQLKDIDSISLLKEILIEYIKFSFAFRYEEKIRIKRSPAETENLLMEMNKYISNELHNKLNLKDIKMVDFTEMKAANIVEKSLEDAYAIFEMFYEEA
ncbi:hypothetical protein KQI77_00055 [Clostridium sp. MSJ-8]|uniref:hypothetical protein n=1 Tax=Clostridium sp. MSJ-8 TaxID=2841510 RepID=UPI001C0F0062|nr:hypothetical protein [Clostridium sp. MSJ-8]MBU5486567.1 hypothetical protein [Clostridium sp. MSJ-8]